MKHNQYLIEQAKEYERLKRHLEEETRNLVPTIYACFCKVLIDDYHNSVEEVESLFARTQEVWNELVESGSTQSMIEWCEEITGVELRGGDT